MTRMPVMPVSMPVMPVSVPTFDTVAMLTVRTPLHLLAQKEKMSNEDLVSTFDTAGHRDHSQATNISAENPF
jgi:hypothetical protein